MAGCSRRSTPGTEEQALVPLALLAALAGPQGSPARTALLQAADQLPFIRFISFISHFFNAFDVSLVSSQVTVDFEHCVEEDNSFY